MPADSFLDTLKHQLNPVDFAVGLYDGAIGDPAKAIRQLTGEKVQPDAGSKTWAHTAGSLVGTAIDFAVLSRVGGPLLKPLFGSGASQDLAMQGFADERLAVAQAKAIAGSGSRMAFAGAVYGGLLTPSSEDKSLLVGRVENALVQGAGLGVMGTTARSMELLPALKGKSDVWWSPVLRNGIAGGASGVPAAYGSIYFSENRMPTGAEVLNQVGQNAAMGAAFGAIDHGINRINSTTPVTMFRWRMEEKAEDAVTRMYSGLNQYGLRHPFQRIGDLVHGVEEPGPSFNPALTAENNPIVAFHTELPKFFKDVDAWHDKAYSDEKVDRYALHKEREELFTDIVDRLHRMWHGTEQTPGIKWHSDAELATPEYPAERVAAVRQAFEMKNRHGVTDEEPKFHDAIERLFPEESNVAWGGLQVLDYIWAGKSRFFGYDLDAMLKKMSMPSHWGYIDAFHLEPPSWSPLDPAFEGPRFYHGTTSAALPQVLEERAIRPAQWVRRRGLQQETGESSRAAQGNGVVSMTRQFNYSQGYTTIAPAAMDEFPILYGIRQEASRHAWNAGHAKSEQRAHKLRIGDSWWNYLGLKRPDVTHIYTPDSQVGYVNNLLQSKRITGVKVVGFSDMPQPQWRPRPTDDELINRYGEWHFQ